MSEREKVTAKSTVGYWDEFWQRASGQTSDSYYRRRLDRALAGAFANLRTEGAALLEVGVGGSEYLPYLHHRFGFAVAGLDYSENGCAAARDLLERTNTPGEIRQCDMFAPPADWLGRFDVVASFGLVEHFAETARAVGACAAFARPGGMVVTLIPNMKGLYGMLFSVFDRKRYDTHVPLDLKSLMKAHEDCGLVGVRGEHLLGLPGVIDGARQEPVRLRRYVRRAVYRCSRLVWALEERGIGVPENPVTSPYMLCTARKP